MSSSRSSTREEIDRNRDPRRRDRSRSDIRRSTPNITETSSPPTNHVVDFFQTLGLNSQLIQALINANPPRIEQISPPPLPTVNNAQEFASFLSQNYGLYSPMITPSPNPSVNRDPRCRPTSIHDHRSTEESYKQFLSSIDQTSLNDETRRRCQRIALLDDELDKLHRMHVELNKTIERHSRRRTSTRDKDSLLKENEHLQHDLIAYTQSLKTSMIRTKQ